MTQTSRIQAAINRYRWRSVACMAIFAAVLLFAPRDAAGVWGYLWTGLAGAPLLLVAYEFQRYVRAMDEMQSLVELQSVAIAMGLALLIGAIWGMGEVFAGLGDVSPALLLPLATLLQAAARFALERRLA